MFYDKGSYMPHGELPISGVDSQKYSIGGGTNSGHVFVFPRVSAILKHVYKNKHMERALLDFFYIKTPFSEFNFF